jgi:hypothetical protein
MKEPLKMENWFATTAVDLYLKDPSALTDMGFGNSMPNEVKYGRYLPGFRKANLSRIMRSYTDAVHLIPADPYDFAGVQRAYETLDKAAMKQGMSYTMQQIMMPVFSQTVVAASKEVSQRNALFQALELLKKGADPANGLPLKDRQAMDTDGKPIRLKKDASGWFIYSVGGDRTDNGGTPLNGTSKGDYVIRLPK